MSDIRFEFRNHLSCNLFGSRPSFSISLGARPSSLCFRLKGTDWGVTSWLRSSRATCALNWIRLRLRFFMPLFGAKNYFDSNFNDYYTCSFLNYRGTSMWRLCQFIGSSLGLMLLFGVNISLVVILSSVFIVCDCCLLV